jgi:hypothetical protein
MDEASYPEWIGCIFGKFRMLAHSEHDDLFEQARRVLGVGLLMVGIESKASIMYRMQQAGVDINDYYVEDDESRLRAIAARDAVDIVFLVDPNQEDFQDPGAFFDKVQRGLPFDFWFTGEHKHDFFKNYERIAREKGAILLWRQEKTRMSTTAKIEELQGKR